MVGASRRDRSEQRSLLAQEVRSSTTALAKTCAALGATHRWMVSGTPLHSGVNDLNGELQFLGVWPFCLSDTEDGFWALKIEAPLLARQPEARAPLHRRPARPPPPKTCRSPLMPGLRSHQM